MHQASPRLYQAQAANTQRTHNARNREQQARERLELRALALGADHALAEVAADAWLLREVLQ